MASVGPVGWAFARIASTFPSRVLAAPAPARTAPPGPPRWHRRVGLSGVRYQKMPVPRSSSRWSATGLTGIPEVGILRGGLIQLLSVSANWREGQVILSRRTGVSGRGAVGGAHGRDGVR